jgi:hypothetical protein
MRIKNRRERIGVPCGAPPSEAYPRANKTQLDSSGSSGTGADKRGPGDIYPFGTPTLRTWSLVDDDLEEMRWKR